MKEEVMAFGGTLAGLDRRAPTFSTWTMAFGGLGITHLAHDVVRFSFTYRAIVFFNLVNINNYTIATE